MGGTGSVTAAGLVFAFTMASMVVNDLRILDRSAPRSGSACFSAPLVVRSFMTPAIATLLGRWFR